jgi:DedD protein
LGIVDRTQFKQRIVGAIVLVALGVIFIPIILNQDGEDSPISGTNIPQKPASLEQLANQQPPAMPVRPDIDTNKPRIVDEDTPLESTTATSPTKPDTLSDQAGKPSSPAAKQQEKTTSQDSKQDTNTAKPVPAKTTETAKVRAWVVQVASFSERKKALKLRDRLRKAKYATFVESLSTSKGTLYRVRVGPVVKRDKAEALKKRIARDFKIKDALVMSQP